MKEDEPVGARPLPGASRRRLCILCRHFQAEAPDHGYYPGDYENGYLDCAKGVWTILNTETDPMAYRKTLLIAETCPHFELADDLKAGPVSKEGEA